MRERITKGEASMDSGRGKEIMEDSNLEEEHFPSPTIRSKMVIPVNTLKGQRGRMSSPVDKIAQGVLTMANLLGGHAAPLSRWIWRGLSVRQPIDQEVVHHLLEAYACAINKEMRRSLSSRSVWKNSFGCWRINQVAK